jgi:hypothetical protein
MLGQIRETLTMAFLNKTKSAAFPAAVILHAVFSGAAPVRSEDIADCFPNLKMPPILAATTVVEEEIAPVAPEPEPWHGDFARIVEEAKREAMGLSALGRTSVTAAISSDGTGSRSFAQFASQQVQPGQRAGGVVAPRGQAGGQPVPGAAAGSPAQPPVPAATPPQPGVVPLPEAAQAENAAVPEVPVDVQRALNNQFARSDVGGLRENWADAPNFVGDGNGPQATGGRFSVGRIMIEASGLSKSGNTLTGSGPAQLSYFTPQNAGLNSIQSIAAAGGGFSPFTLPNQPIGAVAGTTPTSLTGSGIGGVGDPGAAYQSAAQTAFESNPNLPGTNGINGVATYVPGASGSLQTAPASSVQDAYLFYDFFVDSALLLPGYAVGFVKLTENMSPIPRDRVYMNYSYFYNANLFGTQADVNRFMPGFEKTFYDGWTSIEIRTPFAATLDNAQDITYSGGNAAISQYRDIQFGNMSLIFKTLIWERKTWAITAGVQTMLPTADNSLVFGQSAFGGSNIQQVFVANESVHVMPFVGGIWAPNERFFNQVLLQIDRDVNGNLAYVNTLQDPLATGRQLEQAGRIYYPTFTYMSFGTGYWLYKDNRANFTGFSPVMELHVNQALEDFQPLHYQGYQLGSNPGTISVINGLVGCNFEWGTRSTLTFAYVTPLGGGVDRFFDGEVRALYNWRFGPQNRLTRAQF